jgi:tetratricopeptide (TPR) repeat protein
VPDTPQPAPRDTAKDPGSVVEFPGTPEGGRQPNNLPLELSSFVGREREIAEVEGLLLSGRQLLTLCGPGGAGKTRLALAVASRLGDHFEDGVWWVELTSISDPDLVAQAVAQTLTIADESGRPLADILARDLAATELLLVLDNCEHLIEACAELADALLKAPRAYLGIALAAATVWQGDLDLATARIEETIAMCRELRNLRVTGMALFNLGGIELKRGDTKKAAKVFEEGARIARQLGDMLGAAYYVWIFGIVNARLEKPVRAAMLWPAAEALRERMGMSFSRYDLTVSGCERDLTAVRSALDKATFEAAWSEGQTCPPSRLSITLLRTSRRP